MLLETFSSDPLIQQYIEAIIRFRSTDREEKSVARYCHQFVNEEISVGMDNTFQKPDDEWFTEMKSHVLRVVQSRAIKELNPQVQQIIFGNHPSELKLKALSARLTSDPLLTAKEFRMVMQLLDTLNAAPVRQQASRLLLSAELSSAQLQCWRKKSLQSIAI